MDQALLPFVLDNPGDRGQIYIKLRTDHVICQELANFM